jgi:hypothetical protein
MTGWIKLGAALAAGLLLAGCEPLQARYDAAQDVRAFFLAVQTQDRANFERHVDRAALRQALREELSKRAGDDPLAQDLIAEAPDDMLDGLIRPETFRIGVRRMGMSTERVPSAAEIAVLIDMRGADDACVGDPRVRGQCILRFARQGGVWKLVDIDASQVQVRRDRGRASQL